MVKRLTYFLCLFLFIQTCGSSVYYIARRDTGFYDYTISQSCRFNDDDSAHTTWTPGGAADSSRIMTISFWIKRANLGSLQYIFSAGGATDEDWIGFDANDKLIIGFDNNADGQLVTTQVFRDPTSWYHVCVGIDTTQGTAADRVDIEINGVEITAYSTETYPAQNYDFAGFLQNGIAQYISRLSSGASNYLDGYLSHLYIIDGTKYTASTFGETKWGIWIPKSVSPTYGTNGGKYDFSNSSDFGEDQNGSNDFTDSGLATNDQVIDTPTNNYCVLNPLHKHTSLTLSDGGLKGGYAFAAWGSSGSSLSFNSGKWYAEAVIKDLTYSMLGILRTTKNLTSSDIYLGNDTDSWSFYADGATAWKKRYNTANTSMGGTPAVDDVMQIAVNADTGKVWFGVNNVWFGSGDPVAGTNEAYSGLSDHLCFGVSGNNNSGSPLEVNFGQLGFTYTPPSGFKALCSANMDDPTIKNSSDGCVTDTDTGANIATTLAASRSGWVNWIDIYKNLDSVESWDIIFSDDSSNSLHFDTNAAKGAKQSLAAGDDYVGVSLRVGETYGVFTDEVSHTNGVDTDTAHNLGSCDVGIAKMSSTTGSWYVIHPDMTASNNILIDTNAAETGATYYVDVDATNITIKAAAPTGTYRIIALKEVDGFSKFTSHTGNGNADGPYVHSNGRIGFGLYKNKDQTDSWIFINDERLGYNVDNNDLNPDDDSTEGTADYLDVTSKGHKIRSTNHEVNASTEVYLSFEWFSQTGKWSNSR